MVNQSNNCPGPTAEDIEGTSAADNVRSYLASIAITEDDIAAAVQWARNETPNPSEQWNLSKL
jgi:hypothetical protein